MNCRARRVDVRPESELACCAGRFVAASTCRRGANGEAACDAAIAAHECELKVRQEMHAGLADIQLPSSFAKALKWSFVVGLLPSIDMNPNGMFDVFNKRVPNGICDIVGDANETIVWFGQEH